MGKEIKGVGGRRPSACLAESKEGIAVLQAPRERGKIFSPCCKGSTRTRNLDLPLRSGSRHSKRGAKIKEHERHISRHILQGDADHGTQIGRHNVAVENVRHDAPATALALDPWLVKA